MGRISGVTYPDMDTNPGMIRYHPAWASRSLLEFWPTVIPLVFTAPDTYIHLVLHVLLLTYHMLNSNDAGEWNTSNWEPPSLPWTAVTMPVSLLAFFIVFFTGNTFSRYNDLYAECMGITSRIIEITGLCKVHVKDVVAQWDVARLMLASMVVHYYTMDGNGVEDHEWEDLAKHNFLTHNEMQRVRKFNGAKFWVLQCMALSRLKTQMITENGQGVLVRQYDELEELVLGARRACGTMVNNIANPIPFPYYHILLLLIWFTYALISYAMAAFRTPLTVLAFLLIIIVITGMREAAASMANPFGTDIFDFPIDIFIKKTIRATKGIVMEELPEVEKHPFPVAPGPEDARRSKQDSHKSDGSVNV